MRISDWSSDVCSSDLTKFNQVRPLKRGGGRRYYRPEDVALLQRIRELLYREGYTIKGVQKLLRDGAVRMPTAGETARAAQSANPVKGGTAHAPDPQPRSEEHTSELQSLMRISYAVFCLKKKNEHTHTNLHNKYQNIQNKQ